MYAIIQVGGRQHRVEKDSVIDVDLLDAKEGSEVEFKTLFVSNGDESHVGAPEVEGFIVKAEVIGPSVGPKIFSMKYQPRENVRKRWGHRQHYSRIKITSIGSKHESEHKKAAPKHDSEHKKAAPKKHKAEENN